MKITKKERMKLIETLKEKVPDFSLKVAHIYKLLDWEWATMKAGEMLVPTVQVIRETLYRFLDYMKDHESTHLTSGGLGIELEKNEDNSIAAHLYFKLDEYCIPED